MIAVIAGEKGGSGKTTLATNLAVAQAARGPVLLVNCDPQESSPHWVEQRRLHHPEARLIPCVSMRGERIGRDLESLEQAHETLILDTGGRDSAELRAALTVADIAVLPVRPNQLDFATLPKMQWVLDAARGFNHDLRILLVLNQVMPAFRDQAPDDAAAWLAANDLTIPKPEAVIGMRAAFDRATAEGLAVSEMPRRDGKACAEISRVYELVFDHGA